MTLMFTEGLGATGKLELVQPSVAQMFVMVDCVIEMTVKKSCKSGENGSFEHLLSLVWCGVVWCGVVWCGVV